MAAQSPKKASPHDKRAPSERPMSADEVEQRQSLTGAPDEPRSADHATEQPASADMYEQRQDPDGGVDAETVHDAGDEPLTADMIEQRRAVEDDDRSEDEREA